MGDEAFGVAPTRPRDAEEADQVDRDDERSQEGDQRGGGDHVRRRGEQTDVARHRGNAEQDSQHYAKRMRLQEPDQTQEGLHAATRP